MGRYRGLAEVRRNRRRSRSTLSQPLEDKVMKLEDAEDLLAEVRRVRDDAARRLLVALKDANPMRDEATRLSSRLRFEPKVD